jgi:hypothetical protein
MPSSAAVITEAMRDRLTNADRRRLVIRELVVDRLREIRRGMTDAEARELDAAALDHAEKMLNNIITRCRKQLEAAEPAPSRPKLVARSVKTGKVVESGQQVTDHHGKMCTFEQATRANGDDRDGKVLVDGREFYARVFDLIVSEAA